MAQPLLIFLSYSGTIYIYKTSCLAPCARITHIDHKHMQYICQNYRPFFLLGIVLNRGHKLHHVPSPIVPSSSHHFLWESLPLLTRNANLMKQDWRDYITALLLAGLDCTLSSTFSCPQPCSRLAFFMLSSYG